MMVGAKGSSAESVRPENSSLVSTRTGRRVVVAPGVSTPYPEPASDAATAIGKANRRRDTKPELALRSALHRRGLRFRKDHRIDVDGVRVRADVVFTRRRIAVFVDGCFWHGCPEHGSVPRRNVDYWEPKLAANRARDERVDAALRSAGWTVIRVWEHEDPPEAANRIADFINSA